MKKLQTNKVQTWSPSTMMGVISIEKAKELVSKGKFEIISCQAIAFIDEDRKKQLNKKRR